MFDLQTLMAMLQSQGQQQGNPIMATGGQNGQWGGPMGQQMQAQPQMTGQNIGPQQQQAAQGGMSQALLNSGALGGLGMLSAGLQAGGPQPHPTSMGQVLGAGIKGLVGGAQQDQQIQAQRQHADNVFTAQLSRFEPINPGLQTTLARATAGLMHQGYSVEQATAQVFADMAPMLRLKGQAGRPTNTQVGARQIVGNAQAQAAVAAQANGAGRLAPKPMAEMSREDRKAALAAARRSIFATPQN